MLTEFFQRYILRHAAPQPAALTTENPPPHPQRWFSEDGVIMQPSASESSSASTHSSDEGSDNESSDDAFAQVIKSTEDADNDAVAEDDQELRYSRQREDMRRVAKAAVLPDTTNPDDIDTPAESAVTDELIEPLFDLTMSHFDGYFKQTTEALVTWTVENLIWSLIVYTVCDILQSFAPQATVLHASGENNPYEEVVDAEGNNVKPTATLLAADSQDKQTVPIVMLLWIKWIDLICTLITVVYIAIVLFSKRYNGVFSRLYMPVTQAFTGVIGVLGTMFTVVSYKATNSLPWAAAFMGGMRGSHLLATVVVTSGALSIHWFISLGLTFVSTPFGRSNAAFLQLPVAFAFVLMFIIFNETGSRGNLLCTGPTVNQQTLIMANLGIASSFGLSILSSTECDPSNVLGKTFHSTPRSYARVDPWALLHGVAIMLTLVLYAGVRHALFSQTTYIAMIALIAFTLFVTVIQTFDWAAILGSLFSTDDLAAEEMQAAQGAFLEAFMQARKQKEQEQQQRQMQKQFARPRQNPVSIHARNLARAQLGLPPVGLAAADILPVVGEPVRRSKASRRRARADRADSPALRPSGHAGVLAPPQPERAVALQYPFERRQSSGSEGAGPGGPRTSRRRGATSTPSAAAVIKHGARVSAASLTQPQFGGVFRRRKGEEQHEHQQHQHAYARNQQVHGNQVVAAPAVGNFVFATSSQHPVVAPRAPVRDDASVLRQRNALARGQAPDAVQLPAQNVSQQSGSIRTPLSHLMRLQPGEVVPAAQEQPPQHRDTSATQTTQDAAQSASLVISNNNNNPRAIDPSNAVAMFPDIPVSLRREAR